jgi:hypothetical protein
VKALAIAAVLLAASSAEAQDFDGYVSTLFSVMPDVAPTEGRQPVSELRMRFFGEGLLNPGDRWHVRAGVFVDGLAADRGPLDPDGPAGAAIVRPADMYVEYRGTLVDLRAGTSRVVWGRLDEFQPTDVVNPIDLSRFLLEGRSDARLPVAMIRGRLFLPAGSTLEGILVPAFRAARFDQLEEETSPFRLAPAGIVERDEPAVSLGNVQGGARFTSTVGRLDWGVSAWRGFETFPTYVLQPFVPDPLALVLPRYTAVFPRFTMIGGDFETVRGPWGLRGEVAWYDTPAPRSFEGGIGADRRAGSYRVAINALVSHAAGDTDASLVGWAERSFARETRQVRLLAVYDPSDDTAFIRGIGVFNVRDNLSLETSAGWFTGEPGGTTQSGTDVLSLLSRRDFLYVRLKVHF